MSASQRPSRFPETLPAISMRPAALMATWALREEQLSA